MTDRELTQTVRSGFERLCKELTEHLSPRGFQRTKKAFWTRPSLRAPAEAPHLLTVDVLHLHRAGTSYDAPTNASVSLRIHQAVRALNDTFPAIALNGPSSDEFLGQRPGYHLSFNARTFSQYDRCLNDAVRFVIEQGLPWFAAFS